MLTLDTIIEASAAYSGLSSADLLGANTRHDVARSRQRAMYLCGRLRGDVSRRQVGRLFDRTESGVRQAVFKVAALVQTDDEELDAIETLRAVLTGREPDQRLRQLDARAHELRAELGHVEAERQAVIAKLRRLY